eukprot:2382885-Prymnesium_polylepis.1
MAQSETLSASSTGSVGRPSLEQPTAARSFGPAISHRVESSFVLHFFLVLLTFSELFGSAVC